MRRMVGGVAGGSIQSTTVRTVVDWMMGRVGQVV